MAEKKEKDEKAKMEKKNLKSRAYAKSDEKSGSIAIVQLRGTIGFQRTVKDTLNMLGLKKKHQCVIRKKSPSVIGMLRKVDHAVTWGEIDEKTEKEISRRKLPAGLHPPIGGFERKGIKVPFRNGGALGYRGKKINDLLQKMM